jgi:hypothetical protein
VGRSRALIAAAALSACGTSPRDAPVDPGDASASLDAGPDARPAPDAAADARPDPFPDARPDGPPRTPDAGAADADPPAPADALAGDAPSALVDATPPDTGVDAAAPPLHGLLPLAPLPGGPRQEAAVAAIGAEVYVLGGLDETERLLTRVEVYDTLTGAWRAGPELPVPMSHANVIVLEGRLYVLGFLGRRYVPDGRGYVFDPAAGAWTPGPGLPPGRVRGGSGLDARGGRIYVIGGSAVRAVALCDVLDPATGTWTPLPDLPEPRDHLAARFVGGELLVAGGTAGVPEATLATTWALDEAGAAWRPRGPLSVARGVAGAAVLNDRLYVFGGEGLGAGASAAGAFDAVEVYDPAQDAFTLLAPLPAPRRAFGAVEIADRVYLAGGAASLGIFPVSDFAVWAP